MNKQKIHEYIKLIWNYINDVNKYFNDQKPWELIKIDHDRFKNVLSITCELIKRIGILIHPIMPDTSKKILDILNISDDIVSFELFEEKSPDGLKIVNLSQLFPRTN